MPGTFQEVRTPQFIVHKSVLTREGSGIRIPSLGIMPVEGWNGTVVVWAHPAGKASLFDNDRPIPAIQQILDRKAAVVAPDTFLTGEFQPSGQTTPVPWLEQKHHKAVPFAGYFYGYNRALPANRVHDLLTVIGFFHGKSKSIHLAGVEQAGPWALLARALAGDIVQKTAIDLNGFDLDQVKDAKDEMMLPGALKYGGIYGVVPLCASGETVIFNARKTGQYELAAKTQGVTLRQEKASPEEMVQWILK